MPGKAWPASTRPARHARQRRLAAIVVAVVVLFCADLLTGPAAIGLDTFRHVLLGSSGHTSTAAIILEQIRLPQAMMALLTGAALGLAGAEMQTILDNPLASPFTLGVSSAAALGAALAIVLGLGLPFIADPYIVAANAFLFAVACTAILHFAARKAHAGTTGIILLGIAMVFTFNALVSLVQFSASATALQDLTFWMMGSLARSDWPRLGVIALALCLVVPFSLRSAWALTALRFGDERAASFGVDTRRLRRAALVRISVLAAVAVSLTGIIGFVGLVAPHIARRLWGEDHRWYLPASALTGSVILEAAAIVSKLGDGMVIPIGIVTTLVGIPFFCFAVLRRGPYA